MLKLAMTTGLASLFVVGVMSLGGCPGNNGAGEGEGEGEGTAAGEGEGEGHAGEGEGSAGEGEGTAGEGEGEGEGGAAGDEFCQAACTSDTDCTNAAEPKCDTASGVCAPAACTSDDLCTAQNSGWTATACTADADCFGGTGLCVDLDGSGSGTAGGCGLAPSGGTCFFGAAISATDVNGGAITVCGVASTCNQTTKACDSGSNPLACTQDSDCANFATVGLSHCENNECGCAADTDCTGAASAAGPKCYSASHTCGCAANTDCASSASGPTCDTNNGVCTCSADTDCGANQSCAAPATPQ